MHYPFPEIRTIDDVLPAIAGRDEFVVAEREFGTVINYMVAFPDTFAMTGPDDVMGALRRECRGLIFNKAGKIMSRPYHKFFNINEKDETQAHLIDMSQPHVVMDKLDGSMIRPIWVDGTTRLATKMGVTDISKDAEKLIKYRQHAELREYLYNGLTPIFEYISPENKIVVNYTTPKLIMTAIRNNVTGEYIDINNSPVADSFERVRVDSSIHDLDAFLRFKSGETGREGDIIRFADGHMLKVKNEWYVRIHKTKDIVQVDRNIVELVVNEQLDDVLPMLDSADLERVHKVEENFWAAFRNTEDRIGALEMLARTVYGADKKRIALEMVPNLIHKGDGGFLFKLMDGHSLRDVLLEHCKKSIGTTPKYEALMEWMRA